MHDYIKGSFEALSWVRMLCRKEHEYSKILEEVEKALDDLEEGVALDFRRSLSPTHS